MHIFKQCLLSLYSSLLLPSLSQTKLVWLPHCTRFEARKQASLSCLLGISVLNLVYFLWPLPNFRNRFMVNIIYYILTPLLLIYLCIHIGKSTIHADNYDKGFTEASCAWKCTAISEPPTISSLPKTLLFWVIWMTFCLFFRLRVLWH